MSNTHDVQLTATKNGNTVNISGPGGANLPPCSGAHHFNFILDDPTGLEVRFEALDTADSCSTCPPPAGQNSQQIVGYRRRNHETPKKASFTDNNNNRAADGPMDVSYQLNFSCNNSAVTVLPYDPIIINGGQ
ncbi:MAG: hypothetical protein ACR2JJ_01160 [Sphingomicrobium sp.]